MNIKPISNNFLFQAVLIIFGSATLSFLIQMGNLKIVLAPFATAVLILTYRKLSPINRIGLILFLVSFPIMIRVGGRDAISTGTVAIFAAITYFMVTATIHRKQKDLTIFILLTVLILISIFGTLSEWQSQFAGPALRHQINFISSVLFFLFILFVIPTAENTDHLQYIERLLFILIIVVSLQIFIGLLVYKFPNTGEWFSLFIKRNKTALSALTYYGGAEIRAQTIAFSHEELGEYLAVIFPLVLYKSLGNKKYYLFVVIFIIGLFISNTRSALILVSINSLFLVLANFERIKLSVLFLTFGAILFSFVLMNNIGRGFIESLSFRFSQVISSYASNQEITELVNRQVVWEDAVTSVKTNLNLLGNGQSPPNRLGKSTVNYHCLYLTIIFQFGIIGFILYMVFFLIILLRIIKMLSLPRGSPAFLIGISALISFLTFLINEIKFEFNRGDTYQQFVFFYFAICYLISSCNEKKTKIKVTPPQL